MSTIILSCATLLILLSLAPASSILPRTDSPIVKSGKATHVGVSDSVSGVNGWLGIRYAQPPIGPLRLKAPKSYTADGVINNQTPGNICFQLAEGENQSEDCLNLNIFTPAPTRDSKKNHASGLPVMLWIHGGGFNQGSGLFYPPQSIVNRSVELNSPVIVVTINYRLSFFAGKAAIANNALNLGLLDQRQAMKWVRRHISAFGGDPNKVTLFGQSAGATSIGLQMIADVGHEKLFRAAILESGSPADTLPTPPPTWPAYQAAWDAVISRIGCANSTNVFICVQSVPSAILFPVIQAVALSAPLPNSVWPWQPVVDGKFVKDFPSKLTASGHFAKIPMIMGFTTDEVTYVIPIDLNITSDAEILYISQLVLPPFPPAVMTQILALEPLSKYPSTGASILGGNQWKRTTQIASDLFERCPGREWIQNVTKHSPAWKYRWNAVVPEQIADAPWLNIVHSAEIAYVFGPSYAGALNAPLELALSRQVQQAWISFATHLDPNALGPLSPGVKWPAWERTSEQVMVFQKTDGSGEQANGTLGTPVGQGLHLERDPDDRPVCDYYAANDAVWVH